MIIQRDNRKTSHKRLLLIILGSRIYMIFLISEIYPAVLERPLNEQITDHIV